MSEKTKPTATDADLILKLYDLRREPRMREARDYYLLKFFPASYEELVKIFVARGTDENAFLRQVTSYWEMAAAFVVKGVLNEELFFESNPEMYMVYAKLKPFIPQIRKDYSPAFFTNMEKVAEGSPEARERVAMLMQRIEQLKSAAAK